MNANKNSSKASTNDIERGKRIKMLMKERRIKRDELAAIIGKSGPSVTFYTKGGLFPPEVGEKMATALGTSVEYILYGKNVNDIDEEGNDLDEIEESQIKYGKTPPKQEMFNINPSIAGDTSTKKLTSSGITLKPVPYYRTVPNQQNNDNIEMSGEVVEFIYMRDFNDCDMAITTWSNSMAGKYDPGRVLALRKVPDLRLIEFGEVFYIVTKSFKTVKYLFPSKDKEMVELRPHNPAYPAYDIPRELIEELYIVRGDAGQSVN